MGEKRLSVMLFRTVTVLILGAVLFIAAWFGWQWYAIQSEDIEFRNGDLMIRGTLLTPRFTDQTPAVVLVHGSGETSRKSTLPYAWIFASQGYAALAFDKRGVALSDGGEHEWREFNFEDLAGDAAAGYRALQGRPRVDPRRVGFFGASQGAWVVSLAATQADSPAFLIMVSASVSTVAEDRKFGREAQVRHAGFDDKAVAEAAELIDLDHWVTRSGTGFEALEAAWNRYRDADWFDEVYAGEAPEAVSDPHRLWERTVLDFDPQPKLQSISAPVLWVFGDPDLDRFAPVRLSITRLKQAIDGGKPYDIIQIDGAGHTLELEGGNGLRSVVEVRLPLIRRMFAWLEDPG